MKKVWQRISPSLLWHKYNSSEYLKNVFNLLIGTGLSQVISIGANIILVRIYTPEHFGIFALFMSAASIIGNPATGKYDRAILLPPKEKDSQDLLFICLLLSSLFCLFLFLLFFFFGPFLLTWLDLQYFEKWLLFVPALIFINTGNASFLVWLNRKKEYKSVAKGRVYKAAITAISHISFAFLSFGVGGLIFGEIFGLTCLLLYFIFASIKDTGLFFDKSRLPNFSGLMKRYQDFPKYNILADLVGVSSIQFPILLLTSFFGTAIVGLYALTKRVLDAPMTLLTSAILEVFRQRAAEDFNTLGNCKEIFTKTLKNLFFLAFIPFIGFAFFAPTLFEIIFGADWRLSGEIAQILSIMYFVKFISSPLSYVLLIAEKQKVVLFVNILNITAVVGSLSLGYYLSGDMKISFLAFSISCSLVYLFSLSLSYKYAQG